MTYVSWAAVILTVALIGYAAWYDLWRKP